MLEMEKGEDLTSPIIHYVKATAFSLIPTDIGVIDVDGEEVPSTAMTGEIYPSLAQLIAPPPIQSQDDSHKIQ